MTEKEIVLETIKHFTTDGNEKAYDNERGCCVYETEDGKRCGHSIHLTDEARLQISNSYRLRNTTAENVITALGDDIHQPDKSGQSTDFWNNIQSMHDHLLFNDAYTTHQKCSLILKYFSNANLTEEDLIPYF